MIKVIPPNAWGDALPPPELVKVASTGLRGFDLAALIKRASHPLALWVKEHPPRPGEVYVHAVAMGSTESVGPNRNSDGYRSDMLRRDHSTFEKYARWFRDHKNGDPAKSYGVVRKSHFDEDLHRVDTVTALNATKEAAERNGGLIADKELHHLEADRPLDVSMSCFLPGALVRTADGREVPIESISVGDDVVTHHGNVGRVNALLRKPHNGEIVRFRVTGLPDEIACTPDHKIWVRPTLRGKSSRCPVCGDTFKSLNAHLWQKKDPQHQLAYRDYSRYAEDWHRAETLAVGDYVRTPFDTTVDADGDADYAELLGYYLAEGSTWTQKEYAKSKRDCYRGVDFTFAVTETKYVARTMELCRRLGYANVRSYTHRTRPSVATVRVSSMELTDRLEADGGRLAGGKRISVGVMRWNPATQLLIVARFMEGDGTWSRIHESLVGTTISRQLAYDLSAICWRNGIAARINSHHAAPKPGGSRQRAYFVTINQRDVVKIGCDKVPSGFVPTLSFKRDTGHLKYQQSGQVTTQPVCGQRSYVENGFVYRYVSRVARDEYAGDVYDLSVLGDHSYTVFGVAVSNCKVSHDTCVLCGHNAKHRGEYCLPQSEGGTCKYAGCRNALGRVYEDGAHQFVDNPSCCFFDLSNVSATRGADRTAFVTGKVAESYTPGGAELAEQLGLVPPEHLLEPASLAQLRCLRKLAAVTKSGYSLPWADSLAIREKLAKSDVKHYRVPNTDAERHQLLTELAHDGVCLPPGEWLHITTGVDRDKCAAAMSRGVSVQHDLLDRRDLHDLITGTFGDIRVSSGVYSWMAPSLVSQGKEAAVAVVKAASLCESKVAYSPLPEVVRSEISARYLAYQAAVLAANENSENFPLLLSECAGHTRPAA